MIDKSFGEQCSSAIAPIVFLHDYHGLITARNWWNWTNVIGCRVCRTILLSVRFTLDIKCCAVKQNEVHFTCKKVGKEMWLRDPLLKYFSWSMSVVSCPLLTPKLILNMLHSRHRWTLLTICIHCRSALKLLQII